MLIDQLRQALISAQKARDQITVDTLRFALSAIKNYEIDKFGSQEHTLTDEDVTAVLRKLAKQHQESIAAFTAGNRPELADKEQKELAILQTYLPQELSDEEIEKIVKEVIIQGVSNFGAIMGKAMSQLKGRASGNRVAAIVKKNLGPQRLTEK